MSSPPRPFDALRRNGPLLAAAPRIARFLGERAAATRAALDVMARVLAGGVAGLAASPFGVAQLRDAALTGPFETRRPAFDDADVGIPPQVCGGTLGDGSAAAVGLFGVEALARLAGEVAAVTGLATLSAARLPALIVPVLLAACRDESLRIGDDTAALARALIRDATTFAGASHARRVALAAGWAEAPGTAPGTAAPGAAAPDTVAGSPAIDSLG